MKNGKLFFVSIVCLVNGNLIFGLNSTNQIQILTNNFEDEQSTIGIREKRSFYRSGKELGQETSKTLDYLLTESGYNRRLRPQFGGKPVEINVNLAIRSMGPVDEIREVFSLDCYFRQTWTDSRLGFNSSGLSEIALNWAFLAKIWKPDTFFVNGKESFLHKITVPNRFVRISPTGKISYSQRLTIWAGCPMNLRKFPLDSQKCRLEIGSFSYSANDVIYRWQEKPASIDDSVSMAQFHLADWFFQEDIRTSRRMTREGFRNDSSVTVTFLFERQTGFFLLQIYTPLTLIVFCSWVSFWLVRTDKGGEVPARTALGATTVLSIVNLGFGGKSKPKVGYSTAMDVYIIICFASVFAALVEFACINFIDTFIKRFKAWEEAEKERKEKEEKDVKAKSKSKSKTPLNATRPEGKFSDLNLDKDVLDSIPLASEESMMEDTFSKEDVERKLDSSVEDDSQSSGLIRLVKDALENKGQEVPDLEMISKPSCSPLELTTNGKQSTMAADDNEDTPLMVEANQDLMLLTVPCKCGARPLMPCQCVGEQNSSCKCGGRSTFGWHDTLSSISTQDACVSTEDQDFVDIDNDFSEETSKTCLKLKTILTFCMDGCTRLFDHLLERLFRKYHPNITSWYIYSHTLEVVYDVDAWARRLFPLIFLLLQCLYWSAYLYIL